MATVEFFFDCSSPWTYLAFERIEGVAERTGADLIWKPFLVGGVFNAVNQTVYETREKPNPRKQKYMHKDLADWARYQGIRIGWPSVFPVRAVTPMRGALVALDYGCMPAYARATFEAYWGDDRDIADDAVLADIVAAVGLDRTAFFDGIADPAGRHAGEVDQ